MVARALEGPGERERLGLVVSGEAGDYIRALDLIIGPRWLETYPVRSAQEVIELVEGGAADAVVLDEAVTEIDALRLLRIIRRLNQTLLVVLLTCRSDRRWLEEALRLAAFSVVIKPLELEDLLMQVHRMMVRLDAELRRPMR
jgi:DNA-binding NtrC family response regulator